MYVCVPCISTDAINPHFFFKKIYMFRAVLLSITVTIYTLILLLILKVSAQDIPVPNVQRKSLDDGQRNCPKHVEFLDKINL
jgi:hypothetical protein